jgi:alpha-tubulin N-acetyltransferase 1
MLEYEQTVPARLAYDRPSPLLINFMSKHFGLKSFVPQNNNYVIFDEYFRTPA